jgi:hypothetical protein
MAWPLRVGLFAFGLLLGLPERNLSSNDVCCRSLRCWGSVLPACLSAARQLDVPAHHNAITDARQPAALASAAEALASSAERL